MKNSRIHLPSYFSLIILYFLTTAQQVCPCILLLNGWKAASLKERVDLADIVVSGRVQATYKNIRSSSGTYKADVAILSVYKGEEQLKTVAAKPTPLATTTHQYPVYSISNFGDKISCYADVQTGEIYVFFLTIFQGHLSGKYDDIFGAALQISDEVDSQILQILGWQEWSRWGPCRRNCGGGSQVRRRECSKEDPPGCTGGQDKEERQCNLFSCQNAKNVLRLFRHQKPDKVTTTEDWPRTFEVRMGAVLCSPLSALFPDKFPDSFSLMLTAKFPNDSRGYPLAVSDSYGRLLFGLRINTRSLKFEHYPSGPLKPTREVVNFDVNMADGQWHQLAISIHSHSISVFFDCNLKISRSLQHSLKSRMGEEYTLAIGSSGSCYGSLLKGKLSQLMLSSDPQAAKQQCFQTSKQFSIHSIEEDEGEEEVTNGMLDEITSMIPKEHSTDLPFPRTTGNPFAGIEWTAWSECSATCGQGLQTRTYCTEEPSINGTVPCGNGTNIHRVSRPCQIAHCPGKCPLVCLNGGQCRKDISSTPVCICRGRYFGERCANASCSPGCFNGGECVTVGRCRCPPGYKGKLCRQAICNTPCKNGGQCVGPNLCKCRSNYTGRYCSQPLCERGCFHGGKCVAANVCSCPQGYVGRNCRRPFCSPACQNGGVCIYPNRCRCQPGSYGLFCEKFRCHPPCSKERQCVAPNVCLCKGSSPSCRKPRQLYTCPNVCLNGGRCYGNQCQCSSFNRGKRCERRQCPYEEIQVPYTRSYRRQVRDQYTTRCGPWGWQMCVKTRLKHVIVFKDFHRTIYRCSLKSGKR